MSTDRKLTAADMQALKGLTEACDTAIDGVFAALQGVMEPVLKAEHKALEIDAGTNVLKGYIRALTLAMTGIEDEDFSEAKLQIKRAPMVLENINKGVGLPPRPKEGGDHEKE